MQSISRCTYLLMHSDHAHGKHSSCCLDQKWAVVIVALFSSSQLLLFFVLLSLILTLYDLKGLKYPGLPFSDMPGKILSLDLQDPRMKPMELRMPRNFDLESFNPHGLSVYVDQSGECTEVGLYSRKDTSQQIGLKWILEYKPTVTSWTSSVVNLHKRQHWKPTINLPFFWTSFTFSSTWLFFKTTKPT